MMQHVLREPPAVNTLRVLGVPRPGDNSRREVDAHRTQNTFGRRAHPRETGTFTREPAADHKVPCPLRDCREDLTSTLQQEEYGSKL